MSKRGLITALAVGAIAGGAIVEVPRLQEVGTVSRILRSAPTYAVGPVHVTTDSTRAERLATWPMSIEAGIIDAIMHDDEYRDTLMRGIGPAYYTRIGDDGLEHRIVRAIMPIPYRNDALYVLLDDATWIVAHRTVWHLIRPGYLGES